MDAQKPVEKLDAAVDEETAEQDLPAAEAAAVSDERFEEIVSEALDGVDGTMLFKMRLDAEGNGEHVAAASVGEGEARHFLILSLPVSGGELRVEPAADSKNPVAGIAASYAGLAEVFAAAA
ncbi:hypothetical protein RB623_17910 [Mesorhizobium sp. LHD-90]|uniref:hypothetical protein n=1 Tax=Mesorhizobium sp. LHD-90 TaxID=3071414 RepID=UPI0027DF87C8|nr:hypothetical protein [Mesorhizobium sp. LHD-90]MDQ6435935.1 hypothetical protein [Mesorhizobium sp. LHD-90]